MNIVELEKPSLVPDGTQVLSHSSIAFELTAEVERLLIEKGIVSKKVPLSELHKYVDQKNRQVDEHFMNPVNTSFYETSDLFRKSYFNLIRMGFYSIPHCFYDWLKIEIFLVFVKQGVTF